MRNYKGFVLGLAGFAILVTSLVMSTPFTGHGEPRGKRSAPPPTVEVPTGRTFAAAPPADDFDPEPRQSLVTTVQETGPILFKEGELEAYLTFPVPVGKRMIIETASVRANVGAGQKVQVMFSATANSGTASFALPMIPQGSFARQQGDSFAAVQRLRAYADGGTVVTFRIERTAVGELDSGFISISGTLESR